MVQFPVVRLYSQKHMAEKNKIKQINRKFAIYRQLRKISIKS